MNKPICTLTNINKSFGNKKIFDNFTLEIYQGEIVALTGESGRGKSTLLNMIGLLESTDSGNVTLFGRQYKNIKYSSIRDAYKDKLSYLFQNYALVDNKDVAYNLSVPLIHSRKNKAEKKRAMQAALKEVGLDYIDLKQKIYQLSGGEQQRVSLARIFLKPQQLILADEPTGALDTKNRDFILDTFERFAAAGKTVIIATHDPEVVSRCTRVITL